MRTHIAPLMITVCDDVRAETIHIVFRTSGIVTVSLGSSIAVTYCQYISYLVKPNNLSLVIGYTFYASI